MDRAAPFDRGAPPFALLRAIRAVVRADSDPSRQALFAAFLRSSRTARLARRIHGALGSSWLSTALASTYGLRALMARAEPATVRPMLALVAVHANATREVERIASWFEGEHVVRVRFGWSGLARNWPRLLELARAPRRLGAALRIVHAVNVRRDFLLSCRTALLLGCYARGRALLQQIDPDVVVVSSDTNPEELGFSAAARVLGIPTVYVAHAFPPPYAPPVEHTLVLLEGEAAASARPTRPGHAVETMFVGLEGPRSPIRPERLLAVEPVVAVLAPKNVNWASLHEVLGDLRDSLKARRILLRWHPNMVGRPTRAEGMPAGLSVEITPETHSLDQVLAECDWIVSDPGSNVHLDALRRGVPAIAVNGLAVVTPGREDPLGLVANRVVLCLNRLTALRAAETVAFYSGDWLERFTRYDAAAGQSGSDLERAAAAGIRRVAKDWRLHRSHA